MKFQTLDVPNCNENYLDIYDGSNDVGSTLLARLCGGKATSGKTVMSTMNTLYIVLKSGNNSAWSNSTMENVGKRLRFHAEYKAFQFGKRIIINISY